MTRVKELDGTMVEDLALVSLEYLVAFMSLMSLMYL